MGTPLDRSWGQRPLPSSFLDKGGADALWGVDAVFRRAGRSKHPRKAGDSGQIQHLKSAKPLLQKYDFPDNYPRIRLAAGRHERGKARPRFRLVPRRAWSTSTLGTPFSRRIRGSPATTSSFHRALRGDKASQEGCGGFLEAQPSRCRFCRPERFLGPHRSILPLTHSESPSLVAVRRLPFGIQPPEAASVLGGGAGFREAKRGGGSLSKALAGDSDKNDSFKMAAPERLRAQADGFPPPQRFR